jgi:hypothetical protein
MLLWGVGIQSTRHDLRFIRHFNPVVSDDGRFIAFQLARSRDAAGVGHGLFVLALDRGSQPEP